MGGVPGIGLSRESRYLEVVARKRSKNRDHTYLGNGQRAEQGRLVEE